VWGKCKGFGWWPGRIANHHELVGPIDPPDDPTRWIKWFGDYKFTEVSSWVCVQRNCSVLLDEGCQCEFWPHRQVEKK